MPDALHRLPLALRAAALLGAGVLAAVAVVLAAAFALLATVALALRAGCRLPRRGVRPAPAAAPVTVARTAGHRPRVGDAAAAGA